MFNERTILITGGTGSLGHHLIRRITRDYKPHKIIIYSRDEFKQSQMQKEFDNDCLRYFLGDVRDLERLKNAVKSADIVIHAAALKQVPALEYNPTEAVKTNIMGSMNVITACLDTDPERKKKVLLISSDKAVSPINLYGATKLTAEKLFVAANVYNHSKFSVVRYGNVAGSRGSVVPLFQGLSKKGELVFPITDFDMTRFWLTLDDAVDLIFKILSDMKGGEIYVPKIKSAKITDIAKAVNKDCVFSKIGIRPGEKLHECLVSEDNKNVFIVNGGYISPATEIYASDKNDFLSIAEIEYAIKNSDWYC